MNSDDSSYVVSVAKETTLASVNAARKTPAAAKPELPPVLGEDGGEWEGFYEDGNGWEEF